MNKNSYLVIKLQEDTRERLHNIASSLFADKDEIQFDVMNINDLHMTFFFASDKLCHFKKEKLSELYDLIQKSCNNNLSNNLPSNSFNLRFKCLSFFPPEKKNLVVAIFEHNQFLIEKRNQIFKAIKSLNNPELSTLIDNDSEWLPHITLGKLRVSKDVLSKIELPNIDLDNISFKTEGICLNGFIPKQIYLDWDNGLNFL